MATTVNPTDKIINTSLDARFRAEPVGMHNGVASYQIAFFGKPVMRNGAPVIVPASKACNELERVTRACTDPF